MPRKKARNPLKRKQVDHDLAPGELVNKNKKSRSSKFDDEDEGGAAPRGWTRMMAAKKKREEGTKPASTSQKKDDDRGRSKVKNEEKQELKLKPGEKLSDFSRRVDQALPMIRARGGATSPSRMSKTQKRQQQKALRMKEELLKKKNKSRGGDLDEDEAEAAREEEEFERRKSMVKKRDSSPDPWAELEKKRKQPAKFNEVADRPPELKITRRMLNSVPKAAGSMARREILAEERQRVIDTYRALNNKNQPL